MSLSDQFPVMDLTLMGAGPSWNGLPLVQAFTSGYCGPAQLAHTHSSSHRGCYSLALSGPSPATPTLALMSASRCWALAN